MGYLLKVFTFQVCVTYSKVQNKNKKQEIMPERCGDSVVLTGYQGPKYSCALQMSLCDMSWPARFDLA